MNLSRRLLSLARGPWLALTLTITSGVFAGWLAIGQARNFSRVVDGVFLGGKGWTGVRDLMFILAAVISMRAVLTWLMEVSASAVAIRVKTDLRNRLLQKIKKLGPAFTQGERTGELATAALEGIEALDAYFSQYLPQLVLSTIVPISILIFVFPLDPLSGVILLLTAPLIPVFMILIGKGAERVTRKQYETLGRLSAHFLESLQGITTLKQLGRSQDRIQSISESSGKFRDVTMSVLRVTFLSALALELIATVSTAVVAVEVGLRLLYTSMPFDKALFLLILAPEFYIPLRMLGLRFHAGMAGTAAARRIFEILDLKVDETTKGENQTAINLEASDRSQRDPDQFQSMEISDLTFTYPGETQPVLKGINLEIRAGQQIALVGPSGGGKSTLAALLLGFIKPTHGQIRINKEEMDSIPMESWRRMLAWVPQAPYLFQDTIAANLRIARSDASDDELEAAVTAANLQEFIHSLPDGYNTVIGEEGVRLSGGQAQRLALARAFLKDAPILILDEPTCGLDLKTEALLEASISSLMKGRTVITIAHRLNTIARADLIVVLQEGAIVERGNHNEILERGGVYADMVAASYVPGREGELSFRQKSPVIEDDVPEIRSSVIKKIDLQKPGRSPLPRLLGFLRGSFGWVALSVILGALTIGASIGLMGTSSWLIATAALKPSIAELNLAIVGVRFFGLLRGVSRYAERLTSHGVTFRLLARLRTWFYRKLEPLAPKRLIEYHSADLLNRITADVDTLENFYVRIIAPVLTALVVAMGTALFLGTFDPLLGWIYLGFSVMLGMLIPSLTRFLGRKPGIELIHLRSTLRTGVVDAVRGLADLLAFNRTGEFLENIQQTGLSLGEAQKRMGWIGGVSSAAGVLCSNLGMWTVLAFCIPMVASGKMDGVMLPVLALMTAASFEALTPLPLAFQLLAGTTASARRLFEVVEPGGDQTPEHISIRHTGEPLPDHSIQISGLTFRYPGSPMPALREIQFDLPAGKKLAVVGPSGAGKSTLVNLLLRFWEVPPGSIRIGDGDLARFTEEEARRFFSVISQKTFLFHGTIRENLLLAKPGATQEEMEEAARKAEIHEFFTSLTKGYETVVGEGGVRLSGGERQRLAIARALLKNAPIFLLDEPTAHLDPRSGKTILENILQISANRSVLLITHRLTSLERMDEIIVLTDGRISEKGTHEGLLQKEGIYHQMADLQMNILDDIQ